MGYVPSSSYAVLAVNWKTVRMDPDLKRICKGAEVEKLFAQLGIDEGTVTEFAVFWRSQSLSRGQQWTHCERKF
jgi:hypothetical protein